MIGFVIVMNVAVLILLGVELHRAWTAIRMLKDRADDMERRHQAFKDKITTITHQKGVKGLKDLAMREAYRGRKNR